MTDMEKDEKRSSERPDISFSADSMIPARKSEDDDRGGFDVSKRLYGWASPEKASDGNEPEYGLSDERSPAITRESDDSTPTPALSWGSDSFSERNVSDKPADIPLFGFADSEKKSRGNSDEIPQNRRLAWGDENSGGYDVFDESKENSVKPKKEEKKPFIGFSFGDSPKRGKEPPEKDIPAFSFDKPPEPVSEDTLYKEPVITERAEEPIDKFVSRDSEVSNITDRLFGFEPPRKAVGEKVIAEKVAPVIPQSAPGFADTEVREESETVYQDQSGGYGFDEPVAPVIPQSAPGFADTEVREESETVYQDQSGGYGFDEPDEQSYPVNNEPPAEDISPVIPQSVNPLAGIDEPQYAEETDPEDDDFYGGYEEFADIPENNKKPEKEKSEEEDDYDPRYDNYEYDPDEKNKGACFTMRTADDQNRKKTATAQPEYIHRGDENRIAERIAKLRSGLTMRAVMMFFASVFSIFITVANDLDAPLTAVFDRTVNPSAYLFTNTILGIIAIGFGYSMVTLGIKNLLKFSPDSDSLVALNLVIAVVSGLITLFNPETLKVSAFHLYTSVAITGMLFNTLGKLSVARRAERNFEFASSAGTFYAVRCAEDGTLAAQITGSRSGRPKDLAFMRKTDFVRDFIKNSYSYDLADLFAEKAGILILLGSIAVGVLSLVFDPNDTDAMGKVFIFLAAMSGTLSLCSSFALSVVANRPLSAAGREVIEEGGVMLGYSSAEEFADVGSVLFDAEQLFPANSVQLVNIKLLGSVSLDRSLSYAASLAEAGRLLTRPAFERMFEGEDRQFEEVNDCAAEEGTGVSGWISSRRMLLGSREMMKRHKIDGLPSESSEDNFASGNLVLYLAVSGRAAVMFSVRLTADRYTAAKLRDLQAEGVDIYVRCADGILSRTYVAEKFNLKVDKVQLVPSQLEPDVEEMCSPAESLSASMFCSGKAHSFASLLIAAKRVKSSANLGIAVQYGEMVLGIATAAIMMMAGRFGQISPTVAIAFNMAFFAVTLFLQKIRK